MNINADWERLKEKLACHHTVFYKVVEMGKPYLTDKIPTAAVQFNKEGKFINFLFNEKFNNLSSKDQYIYTKIHLKIGRAHV